jgi:hypothetical protein
MSILSRIGRAGEVSLPARPRPRAWVEALSYLRIVERRVRASAT